jgi:hypothetical protein
MGKFFAHAEKLNIHNYSEKIKMSTKLQKDANRENAKKSTGPKTKEGKAKSAQNAVTHGLTARYEVITTEDQQEYDFFRKEMIDHLNPIDPMQYRLADRIVSLSWRLKRAEIMHDRTIEDLLQKDIDCLYDDMDDYRIDENLPGDVLALGHMAESDFSGHRVLDRLIMYERRIENSLYKTMKELKILKKEKTQNEPNYNQPRPKSQTRYGGAETTTQYDIRNTQYEINMQNEPNLQNQMNLTPDITRDYENKHNRQSGEINQNSSDSTTLPPVSQGVGGPVGGRD